MAVVIVFDLTRYIIPNWLNGVLLLLYPFMLWMMPGPVAWGWALLIGAVTFAVGFAMFNFRLIGGGDVKLLAVCALWAGTGASLEFFVYTGLLGGVLSLLLVVTRPAAAWWFSRWKNAPAIPRVLTYREPVPYGLAIAAAFLIVLWLGKIPGLPIGIAFS